MRKFDGFRNSKGKVVVSPDEFLKICEKTIAGCWHKYSDEPQETRLKKSAMSVFGQLISRQVREHPHQIHAAIRWAYRQLGFKKNIRTAFTG